MTLTEAKLLRRIAMVMICEDCKDKLRVYGWACFHVLESVADVVEVLPYLIHIENENDDSKFMCVVFRFLERKGYLLSTEIDNDTVAYTLNTSKALYSSKKDELCWCRCIDKCV